jgi:hypothetical protein
MLRSPRLVPVALLLAACASPVTGDTKEGTAATGPKVDLGGFVSNEDLAQPPQVLDMAKTDLAVMSSSDMAQPKDMAMTPADMAQPQNGNCGAITYNGICQGDVLKWCDNGTLQTVDCFWEYFASCEVHNGVADCYY